MHVMSSLLVILLCIHGLKSTYTFQSVDPGILFRQQAALVQERVINTNPDPDHSIEDTEYSDNHGGAECGMGQLFYLTEEGRLMRCDTNKLSVVEQSSQPPGLAQNSPYLHLPGLPSLGLTFLVGARQPGTSPIQNQDIGGDEGIHRKKPVVIKPNPVLVKPIHKPKPILTKPVHKPFVHKHPHLTHHHCKPSVHVAVSELSAYHQTGLDSVYQEGKERLREEQLGLNPVYSAPYWHLIAPHRQVNILIPNDEQRVVAQYQASNTNHPEGSGSLSDEKMGYDDSKDDEGTVRSEIFGNVSSERSVVEEDRKHIMTINLPKNTVEVTLDLNAANNIGDDTTEQKYVEEPQSSNRNDENGKEVKEDFEATNDEVNAQTEYVKEDQTPSFETEAAVSDGHEEFKAHGNEPRAETTEDYNVEPNTGQYEVAKNEDNDQKPKEDETEKSLSNGPDVMEDASGELEAAHVRKIREDQGVPIDILSDQQRPLFNSVLDRNTLLNIMSSLKEQYLKSAEPEQRKSIEDAFDRLHCSVRDMKTLDERPAGRKIDGSKKAALKLLAERTQPQMEEPDNYSNASADSSFLELLNVATKHKGKQFVET